ncbi:MAG: 50S ribosomal protein L11 methyltransferase, partial [Bacteriovoracaceae bacterium]|nr:50S ribosomal protein L11 methyltransferase [Bacteriovoracaceae bacterium]
MSYYLVTIFNIGDASRAQAIQEIAMDQFNSTGVEEYSIDEARVDEILGSRSYSGGDLPLEVLNEVDQIMHQGQFHNKFFFDENSETKALDFLKVIKTQFLCESQIEKLEDQDWNSEWKKHYKPIDVTENFSILPAWEDPALFERRKIIRIHPGMGFGTGS